MLKKLDLKHIHGMRNAAFPVVWYMDDCLYQSGINVAFLKYFQSSLELEPKIKDNLSFLLRNTLCNKLFI